MSRRKLCYFGVHPVLPVEQHGAHARGDQAREEAQAEPAPPRAPAYHRWRQLVLVPHKNQLLASSEDRNQGGGLQGLGCLVHEDGGESGGWGQIRAPRRHQLQRLVARAHARAHHHVRRPDDLADCSVLSFTISFIGIFEGTFDVKIIIISALLPWAAAATAAPARRSPLPLLAGALPPPRRRVLRLHSGLELLELRVRLEDVVQRGRPQLAADAGHAPHPHRSQPQLEQPLQQVVRRHVAEGCRQDLLALATAPPRLLDARGFPEQQAGGAGLPRAGRALDQGQPPGQPLLDRPRLRGVDLAGLHQGAGGPPRLRPVGGVARHRELRPRREREFLGVLQ
mmetsp:Transcript_44281/g.72259  ORF Transcript_44281/g.72259 Transcript_44281/m.72259 type:complete len:340 (+) Transcript_44281:594-1613(+)